MMSSLRSCQIAAGIIVSLCFIYVILSSFYSLSYDNMINSWRVTSRHVNVQKLVKDADKKQITVSNASSITESYICDYKKNEIQQHKTQNSSFEWHLSNALQRK